MSDNQNQVRIDALIAALPEALMAGEETLVLWIGDFAALNDDWEVTYDDAALARLFEEAGFRPTEKEQNAGRITLKEHGPEAYRRRLFQFAYHFFQKGMPVPEVAASYARLYFEFTGTNPPRLW